jgi:hypothetical protein
MQIVSLSTERTDVDQAVVDRHYSPSVEARMV